MIAQETHEPSATSHPTSTDEIRTELYRMLDELVTSRGDTAAIRTRFTELWDQLGRNAGETLH